MGSRLQPTRAEENSRRVQTFPEIRCLEIVIFDELEWGTVNTGATPTSPRCQLTAPSKHTAAGWLCTRALLLLLFQGGDLLGWSVLSGPCTKGTHPKEAARPWKAPKITKDELETWLGQRLNNVLSYLDSELSVERPISYKSNKAMQGTPVHKKSCRDICVAPFLPPDCSSAHFKCQKPEKSK